MVQNLTMEAFIQDLERATLPSFYRTVTILKVFVHMSNYQPMVKRLQQ
jgi:hypothetical protein